MSAPKLVIFDCDGVLVDSELITNRVFAQMIRELGVPITVEELFERFVGHSMPYCCGLIMGMTGQPLPATFVADYHARITVALTEQLQPVAGIQAVLQDLSDRHVPYCVASSGSHEKMRTTLGITGLMPRFEGRLFSVTEVAHAKPAPDVFLYAAGRYDTAPADCAIVEDTSAGVRAGVAAGMRVYGYCALTPKHRLEDAGAHVTFDQMAALPGLLFAQANASP